MDRPLRTSRTSTPSRSLRRAVEGVKCGVVGTLAFVAVATAAWPAAVEVSDAEGVATDRVAPSPQQQRITALMARHQCSATGFGPDVVPGSALVLRGGRVRHVSFDDGWAVYTGDRPGTLVAVCLVDV